MKTYEVCYQGNDVWEHTEDIKAKSIDEVLKIANARMEGYQKTTIEALSIVSIAEFIPRT